MKVLFLKKDSSKSFSFLKGINRAINPAQVTKLANSINSMGCVRPIVVATISFLDGKPTQYIIDGQHLFYALLRNNMDFPYVEIKVNNKQEMVEKLALLNASSKSWTMLDYIQAWSCISEDFAKLKTYFNTYDLELNILGAVLSGRSSDLRITSDLKKGTYRIENEKENVKILDYLTDMLKVVPRLDRKSNLYACTEYVNFLRNSSNYNHTKFIKNISKHKEEFTLVTQEPGKLSQIFSSLSK